MNLSKISLIVGLLIMLVTHVYMLFMPNMTATQARIHAGINLFAYLLILSAVWKRLMN